MGLLWQQSQFILLMLPNLFKLSHQFALQKKGLKITAISIPSGIRVTYPNLNNKTH